MATGFLAHQAIAGNLLVVAAAALAALLAVQQVSEILVAPIRERIGREVDGRFRKEIAHLALSPVGVAHLDDPDVTGLITQATADSNGFTPGRSCAAQVVVISQGLASLGCLGILFFYHPQFAALILILLVAARIAITRIFLGINSATMRTAHLAKQSEYWRRLATGTEGAKEVRIFGLDRWLVEKWRDRYLARMQTVWRVRSGAVRVLFLPLATVFIAALTGLLAVTPTTDAGAVAQQVIALFGALSLGSVSWDVFVLAHGRIPLDAANRLRRMIGEHSGQTAWSATVEKRGVPSISFEDVHFGYAGDRPVLSGLNLEVRPGEVTALVGVNGAGKSTSVKLLQRLYEPEHGRITVDGLDIRDLDPRAWRSEIAVVTQNYARFDLSLRDNIALAAPERFHDAELFNEVAAELDLENTLPRLPQGWDTPLSKTRTGGTDLSGGQWQRIALARAIFAVRAGRRILVLDEPTAHLDAEAEFEVFQQVIRLAKDVSVLLISHRLSTVRLADRIAVLREGSISEVGTHSELVASGAHYARLFDVQARPFVEEAGQ